MAIIGIDLGTTNSLAAYYKEDHPILIPNIYGEKLTPSVVSIDENGEIYVGRIAQERLISHPELTVHVFKRSMGSRKNYKLGSKNFSAEELSALVIRKLKEDAEVFLGEEVDEAVISVPAYFNDTQRRATKTAGELAGLKTERIVNEPTAAAVAYGLHDEQDYTKYLVFDLGGGTFDVSILEKYDNVMEVRAVAGDNFLGGEDFTHAMMDWYLDYHRIEAGDLTFKEKSLLRKNAEEVKKALSHSRSITMSCVIGKVTYDMLVTPEGYEKRCESLLARLRNPIKRALSDASIRLQDIESVLLVGGATKMSLIRSFVSKLMGRFPSVAIDPDEVVAMGTAVHSAIKRRNRTITEIVLTDVCPYTLGTNIAMRRHNGFHESGHFYPIIERNSVIPISRSERLVTVYDNQNAIKVDILQGESRKSDDNVLLGKLQVSVPEGKAGQESIDVRYTYDINGILEVDVTVVSTGITKTLVLEKNPGILTDEEIAEKLEGLKSLKVHPRDKDENRLLLARAERLFEENTGDARAILSHEIVVFENLLDRQDERLIRDYAIKFTELLQHI